MEAQKESNARKLVNRIFFLKEAMPAADKLSVARIKSELNIHILALLQMRRRHDLDIAVALSLGSLDEEIHYFSKNQVYLDLGNYTGPDHQMLTVIPVTLDMLASSLVYNRSSSVVLEHYIGDADTYLADHPLGYKARTESEINKITYLLRKRLEPQIQLTNHPGAIATRDSFEGLIERLKQRKDYRGNPIQPQTLSE